MKGEGTGALGLKLGVPRVQVGGRQKRKGSHGQRLGESLHPGKRKGGGGGGGGWGGVGGGGGWGGWGGGGGGVGGGGGGGREKRRSTADCLSL